MNAPPTVLVVDDESGIVNKLHMTLSRLTPPVRTIAARTGRQALDILATERVDLVLTDDKIGDMGGLDLLAAVHRKRPDVERVAMLEAQDLPLASDAVKEGHVHSLIEKPVDSILLGRTVASLVTARLRKLARDHTVQRITEIARRRK